MDVVTDDLWSRVSMRLPIDRRRSQDRAALNGILWKLATGETWHDLPRRFPSYSTCWRRYREWSRSGVLGVILCDLKAELEYRTEASEVGAPTVEVGHVPGRRPHFDAWILHVTLVLQSPEAGQLMQGTNVTSN